MKNLFKKINLDTIINIDKIDSSQNKVYKVTTKDNLYIVKEYSKDAIKDESELKLRKEQINVSKILNDNGIPTIIPIEFENEYFIKHNDNYYLIYYYFNYDILQEKEVKINHIKLLSETLAKIHNLNIKCIDKIQYKYININLDFYLNKFNEKKEMKNLYNIIYLNKNKLINLIKECNDSIPIVYKDLCISHNDYKLKNILWKNNKLYLIDFDATSLANPLVSLAESAFSLSKIDGVININYYEEFIKNYLKNYYNSKINYDIALKCAMNGKLQWLKYLLDNNLEFSTKINDSIEMIKELILYINYQDTFLNIYNKLI